MKLVEVVWKDSAFTAGWHRTTENIGISTCKTVGYLAQRNKRQVVIAMNITDEDHVGECMAIPASCVKSIKKLKSDKKKA